MKKIIALIFAALIIAVFSACDLFGAADYEPNIWVVNSSWDVVKEYRVATSSRELTSADLVAEEVEAYNATHTDDQLRVIDAPEALDVEEAPDATIYEAYGDTNEIIAQVTVLRKNLRYERGRHREQVLADSASSGRPVILYVDNEPPDIVVTGPTEDLRSDYEKYAIYVIDAAGEILFEEHPLTGQALIDYFMGDETKTAADWYYFRTSNVTSWWRDIPGADRVIFGEIYPPEELEEPEEPVDPELPVEP